MTGGDVRLAATSPRPTPRLWPRRPASSLAVVTASKWLAATGSGAQDTDRVVLLALAGCAGRARGLLI